MADISFLSIKIFVEVSKIRKNGKRVLYMVLNVLSNEKIKKYIQIYRYCVVKYVSLKPIREKQKLCN
jgi:hypothetical protein